MSKVLVLTDPLDGDGGTEMGTMMTTPSVCPLITTTTDFEGCFLTRSGQSVKKTVPFLLHLEMLLSGWW